MLPTFLGGAKDLSGLPERVLVLLGDEHLVRRLAVPVVSYRHPPRSVDQVSFFTITFIPPGGLRSGVSSHDRSGETGES